MIKLKNLLSEDKLFISINPTGESVYKYELFLQNSTKKQRKKYFDLLGAVITDGDYNRLFFIDKEKALVAKNKIEKALKKNNWR